MSGTSIMCMVKAFWQCNHSTQSITFFKFNISIRLAKLFYLFYRFQELPAQAVNCDLDTPPKCHGHSKSECTGLARNCWNSKCIKFIDEKRNSTGLCLIDKSANEHRSGKEDRLYVTMFVFISFTQAFTIILLTLFSGTSATTRYPSISKWLRICGAAENPRPPASRTLKRLMLCERKFLSRTLVNKWSKRGFSRPLLMHCPENSKDSSRGWTTRAAFTSTLATGRANSSTWEIAWRKRFLRTTILPAHFKLATAVSSSRKPQMFKTRTNS